MIKKIKYSLVILLFSLPIFGMENEKGKGREEPASQIETVTVTSKGGSNIEIAISTTRFGFGNWLNKFPEGPENIELDFSEQAIRKLIAFECAFANNEHLLENQLFDAIEKEAHIFEDLPFKAWQELKELADFLVFKQFTDHLEYIIFIAEDGRAFGVPISRIRYVRTISETLNEKLSKETGTGKFWFRFINAQDFTVVVAVLEAVSNHSTLSGKELLDTIKGDLKKLLGALSSEDLLSLLSVANFLDFPVLLQLIAQLVAEKIACQEITVNKIKSLFYTVHPILAEIERQHYLLYGDHWKLGTGVVPEFSVKELYDYNKGKKIVAGRLDLSKMRINCLEGLETIPGISAVKYLDLSENRLKGTLSYYFKNLPNIKWLGLHNNHLRSISKGVFDYIPSLKRLLLHNNKLIKLPKSILNTLTDLLWFSVGGNELTKVPGSLFKKNKRLRQINLNKNKLTSLPESIFRGLTHLKYLSLSENPFSDLSEEIFKNLRVLEFLYLNKIKIKTIPTTIFGLTALEHLYLKDNQFNESIEEIRKKFQAQDLEIKFSTLI